MGIFLVLAIIIGLDIRYPESSFMKTVRIWQTLLGAVLGLVAVSLALILEEQIGDEREAAQQRQQERALLNRAIKDLEITVRSFSALYTAPQSDEKFSPQGCINLIQLYQSHPIRGLTLGRQLDAYANSLSVEAYSAIAEADQYVRLTMTSIQAVTIKDCIVNSEKVSRYLISTAENATNTLTAAQNALKTVTTDSQ